MPTRHILSCPNCLHELLIDVEGAVGGVVQDNLRLVASRAPEDVVATAVESPVLTPVSSIAPPEVEIAEPAPAEVVATPAAEAHAAATGVDLAAVEGSGADGKVLKADVEAAAAGQSAEATE